MAEQAYQSLYRRYRPQRFSEVRGQDHVTRALRNSVRNNTVHHAYLFSGPRGTGKTSTARILAKALNCLNPSEGEPCCVCESCVAVAAGSSLDVHELDAASNNGVDAMRDLVARAALGTPGRWKVYIVDEVHMLTAGASNALLKTLEEPPGHVVFVLATTDPQKVLDTIKSRTQHFEFRLLGGDVLSGLLQEVSADAGLGLPSEAIDLAVRRGHGSARDALSFLDQVAAAGVVEDEGEVIDRLIEALVESDPPAVLAAVAEAHAAGRDPQRVGTDLLAQLRYGFLATMAPTLVPLPDEARDHAAGQAHRLGTPALVRAMETVGRALVDMREALDARVHLEVALIRLARPDLAGGPEGLGERIDRLERRLAQLEGSSGPRPGSGPVTEPSSPSSSDGGGARTSAGSPPAPQPAGSGGAAGARAALGAVRRGATTTGGGREQVVLSSQDDQTTSETPPQPASSDDPNGRLPTRDEIVKAWGDGLYSSLKGGVKALYGAGRFARIEEGHAVFGVPNEVHRKRCQERQAEVEDALSGHFGVRVPIRVVVAPDVDAGPAGERQAAPPDDEETVDPAELSEAAPAGRPEERLLEAFPGATEV